MLRALACCLTRRAAALADGSLGLLTELIKTRSLACVAEGEPGFARQRSATVGSEGGVSPPSIIEAKWSGREDWLALLASLAAVAARVELRSHPPAQLFVF